MSDPFADYGKRATTTQPTALVGPMKQRAVARERYAEILAELNACNTPADVERCLAARSPDITQYKAELEFLWLGDDDFRGLEKEIEWATARVDERLDFPRWEPRLTQAEARN